MSMKSDDGSVVQQTTILPICVIFPGALGDFLCLLPALRALAKSHSVVLYTRSRFAELIPAAVSVRSIERSEISRLFIEKPELDSQVIRALAGFAKVYSWMGYQQPAVHSQLQRATNGSAEIFPFRPSGKGEHQTDYYLRCLGFNGGSLDESTIEVDSGAVLWSDEFWQKHSLCERAVLAIAPGSGAREKNWPEEFFVEVADWWRKETEGVPLLVLGPVEAERGGTDQLREHCLVAADLRLSQVAALLKRSTLYVGNDSGISHLAAGVGALTVALFGPSDPTQWAPRGRRVTVISQHVDCSPCAPSAMKTCHHRRCLTELAPDHVITLMRQLRKLASLTRGGVGITV